MKIQQVRPCLTKALLILMLAALPFSIPPGPVISSVPAAAAEPQAPFTLHGTVKDQAGNPVLTGIYVTDLLNHALASLPTDANGGYSVALPLRQEMVVNAFPQGVP